MISLAIIAVGLIVGFVFFRKQTKKILLVVALSIAAAGAVRLVEIAKNDEGFETALIALAAMGAIWLVSWLLNRSMSQKKAPKVAPKTRSGPPKVNVR